MKMLLNAKQGIQAAGGKGDIRIRTWPDGGWVNVEISDTGDGIPEDRLERIFDPGFKTKGVKVVTGLDLLICD